MIGLSHPVSMIRDGIRKWHAQILLCATGSAICLFSAGVGWGQGIETPGEKGNFLLRPETTFQHYCAPCHGETAQGDGRYFGSDLQPLPRDLTDAAYMNSRTDEELLASISDGTASIGKSNLCPPWGITLGRERIEGLVRHLRSLSRASAVPDTEEGAPQEAAAKTTGGTDSPLQLRSEGLRLVALIAISLMLLGTAWVQWRKLQVKE